MRSWVKGDEIPAQIPKPDFRKPKVMYTIFFNSGGIVLQLPCKSGKTVNATFFTEKVLPNLIKNVKEVRPKKGLQSRNPDPFHFRDSIPGFVFLTPIPISNPGIISQSKDSEFSRKWL